MTRDDMSPSERTQRAKIAAHTRWGRETDRTAATQPARDAFRARFDAQIPDTVIDPQQRAQMVDSLIKAHYQRLALKSAQARRRKRGEAA